MVLWTFLVFGYYATQESEPMKTSTPNDPLPNIRKDIMMQYIREVFPILYEGQLVENEELKNHLVMTKKPFQTKN